MGAQANLSDIYCGDHELLVKLNPYLAPIHGVRLSPELLQRAIGIAVIIVHSYNSDFLAYREIEDHIQQLAA